MVQVGRLMGSLVQLEVVEEVSQSPHEFVTTTPVESTAVAHQGVGESV